jgi:hypothetical protein
MKLVGRLDQCYLLSFRVPLSNFKVPAPLQPLSKGDWGFMNVVICKVEKIRPRYFPEFSGSSYWHFGIRALVKVRESHEEGLYFFRSDADSRMICTGGNWLTPLRLHLAEIEFQTSSKEVSWKIRARDGMKTELKISRKQPRHWSPQQSAFQSEQDAAAFLKYQPVAFGTASPKKIQKLRVDRDETLWKETPVVLEKFESDWFQEHLGSDFFLERAIEVAPLPYRWVIL